MLRRATPILNVLIDSKYVIKKRGLQGENDESKSVRGGGLERIQGLFEGSLSPQWRDDKQPRGTVSPAHSLSHSTHLAPCSRFCEVAAWVTFSRHSSKHSCFSWEPLHEFKPRLVFGWAWMPCQGGAQYLLIRLPKALLAQKDISQASCKPLFLKCRSDQTSPPVLSRLFLAHRVFSVFKVATT